MDSDASKKTRVKDEEEEEVVNKKTRLREEKTLKDIQDLVFDIWKRLFPNEEAPVHDSTDPIERVTFILEAIYEKLPSTSRKRVIAPSADRLTTRVGEIYEVLFGTSPPDNQDDVKILELILAKSKELSGDVERLQVEVDGVSIESGVKDQEIESLKAEVEAKDQTISELQTEIEKWILLVSQLKDENATKDQEIAELGVTESEVIFNLRTENGEAMTRIQLLEGENIGMRERLDFMVNRITWQHAHIESLQADMSRNKGALDEIISKIDVLKGEIPVILGKDKSKILELKSTVDVLLKAMDDALQRITDQVAEMDTYEDDILHARGTLKARELNIGALEVEIANLKRQLFLRDLEIEELRKTPPPQEPPQSSTPDVTPSYSNFIHVIDARLQGCVNTINGLMEKCEERLNEEMEHTSDEVCDKLDSVCSSMGLKIQSLQKDHLLTFSPTQKKTATIPQCTIFKEEFHGTVLDTTPNLVKFVCFKSSDLVRDIQHVLKGATFSSSIAVLVCEKHLKELSSIPQIQILKYVYQADAKRYSVIIRLRLI